MAPKPPWGAAPRGAPPTTAGEPDFLWRKSGERTPGRKRFFLPGPTFSSLGGPCGGPPSFFAWPAALYPTPVTARPPAGRAGRGGCCSRKGKHPRPKPSPRGEGGPAKPGRMRGRSCTQPFLVEKRRSPDCRPNGIFLLLRWASRSPPHPSPSVTASPPRGRLWGWVRPFPTTTPTPSQPAQLGGGPLRA